jgi:CPA2 family monovalent cation:H+ antiporter-2
MGESHFLVNVGMALLAALVGGFVARRLRLPLLVGYLLAGIVVGPHTPGFIADEEAVHSVAKLGVALLMFAVGVQFHLDELIAARRIALVGGSAQILGTILLGVAVGLGLGWGGYGGLFLGCAIALSSTAVMMRILEERGELGTTHGTAILAILVMQDLSVVLMATLLPSLALLSTQGPQALLSVGRSLFVAIASVIVTLALAMRGVPALLDRVARMNSSELFLLTVVGICLAAAYLAQLAGLSLEIGAFLAGLVISESDYAHEAFSQVRPLRDVFASLFFVSVGMLLNPAFLVRNWPAILAVVLAIVIGKAVIASAAVYALGLHGRTSLFTGLGLAQIGEFSFVLAGIGTARGLIPNHIADVILAAALISMLLTPFVYGAAGPLYARLNAIPAFSRLLNRQTREEPVDTGEPCAPRALILGGGRVGRYVSEALRAQGVPQIVVDYDGAAVARLRAAGVPALYGDATSEVVLKQAAPHCVELAVVTLPEAGVTQMAVRLLKRWAPELPVLARVNRGADIPHVRAAGADMVFYAEFEAATTIIRHTLARLKIPAGEIEAYIDHIRQERYREEGAPSRA